MDDKLYHYRAIVRSVYDGDTCTVDIDLGLGSWIHGEKLRLHGINAPELRGQDREAGLRSRDFLRSKIDGQEIFIRTLKDKKGKYGRYIADIWVANENGTWVKVNDLLVERGFAVYKAY